MNIKKVTAFALTGLLLASVPAIAHEGHETGDSHRSGSGKTTVSASRSEHRGYGYRNRSDNGTDYQNNEKGNRGRNESHVDCQVSEKSGSGSGRSSGSDGEKVYGRGRSSDPQEKLNDQSHSGRGRNRDSGNQENRSDENLRNGKNRQNANTGSGRGNGEGRDQKDEKGNGEGLKDGSGPGTGYKDGFHRNRHN